MADENHDVFADDTEVSEGAEVETEDEVEAEEAETDETEQTDAEGTEDTAVEGEEEADAPAAAKTEVTKAEKSIPEHRHKAALKGVTTKLAAKEKELEELRKQYAAPPPPAPDRETDPDGYDQHMRMETSKAIMSDAFPDYNDKIMHYHTMAEANPALDEMVARNPNPAKFAYDIAKADIEIRELRELKNTPRWKRFEEWEKANPEETVTEEVKPAKKRQIDLATRVPNLNRTATAINPKQATSDVDDDLWKGHPNKT